MSDSTGFDAVLLAGGKSSRFGTDKAFLDWRGEPLYLRQLATLSALGPDRIFLSANGSQDFPDLPDAVETVRDEKTDLGPLAGLLAVFRRSKADRIVVLGVDLPLMEADFLATLLASPGGTAPKRDGFWEPLVAVYPREAMLAILEDAAAADERKLQLLLDRAEAAGQLTSHEVSPEERLLFTNLNSARDFAALDPNRFDDEIVLRRYLVGEGFAETPDHVAAEEPLEIRVNGHSVAVTMRTPGHDDELATGFLYTEGVIESAKEIATIVPLPDVDRASVGNTLEVELSGDPDLSSLTRHVFTSSSCGICGKATIDSVFRQFPPIEPGEPFPPEFVLPLPDRLRSAQETFDRTGGLHASALFDRNGDLLVLREDVGRHNALDKVIGHGLREGIDFSGVCLLVSGRISFELMQKSLSVGIPLVAGISAPSSLAVKLARESGQTLVGFLRGKGYNLYAGELR